jgi:hypothetical protein
MDDTTKRPQGLNWLVKLVLDEAVAIGHPFA